MGIYEDNFLADPERENNYVAILSPMLLSSTPPYSTDVTLRVASRKFDTGPNDTPANTRFWPRLVGTPYRYSTTRAPLGTTSFLPIERGGKLVLGQLHGDLDTGEAHMLQVAGVDSIRDLYFGGRDIQIYHGGSYNDGVELPFSEYRSIFIGKMAEGLNTRDTFEIDLRDSLSRFDQPFQSRSFGGFDDCLYSDGSSAYVTIGTNAAFDRGDNQMSWGFRIWIESLPVSGVAIICRGSFEVDGYRILLTPAGKIQFETNELGSAVTFDTTETLVPHRWYSYTMSINDPDDPAYTIRTRVDGQAAAEGVLGPITANAARNLHFLRFDSSGATNPNIFIDEIKCWNVARTLEQDADEAFRTLTDAEIASANLIGYWTCDEGTGTTLGDSSGTNADGTITGCTWYHSLTGDATIAGQVLPDVFGRFDAFEPVLVNDARQIYQVHSGQVHQLVDRQSSTSAVWLKGGKIPLNVAYTSFALFAATPTPAGKFDSLNVVGGTWIRLGTPPNGPLVVSGFGDKYGGTYRETASDLIRLFVTTRGTSALTDPTDLDTTSFDDLNTDAPAVMTFATKTQMTILDVINYLLNTVGAVAWFKRNTQLFRVERFEGASPKTAVLTIDERDITGDSEEIEFPVDPPIANWTINCRRTYLKHALSDLVPNLIKTERGKRLVQDWQKVTARNTALHERYEDALSVTIDSAFAFEVNAVKEIERRKALFSSISGSKPRGFQFRCKDRLRQLDVMDVVYFNYRDFDRNGQPQQRFGSSTTFKCIVLSITELDNNEVELTLWREAV